MFDGQREVVSVFLLEPPKKGERLSFGVVGALSLEFLRERVGGLQVRCVAFDGTRIV